MTLPGHGITFDWNVPKTIDDQTSEGIRHLYRVESLDDLVKKCPFRVVPI
ncbi:MAG: hypothetical protein N0C81_13710 [Candidatus Thiodiazotropha lotti]|nr:hypothetical protein [Candidatus Thiodiazotropha lotti]MCG7923194.1 hypothetical protein [Candidatus Thiodiazotropha lotti]MCG7932243.1 hypothetical protein [Candidatus Thiodiazotropha lotti]MCG8003056.1 hypothetical protein [Candidatus Thiodiazotropha lotti]MCG8008684.1 hypothetical protein [Candidatus Thiodiazotropha lotti]